MTEQLEHVMNSRDQNSELTRELERARQVHQPRSKSKSKSNLKTSKNSRRNSPPPNVVASVSGSDLTIPGFVKGDYDTVNIDFEPLPSDLDPHDLYVLYIDESSYLTLLPNSEMNVLDNLKAFARTLAEASSGGIVNLPLVMAEVDFILETADEGDPRSIGCVTRVLLEALSRKAYAYGGLQCPEGCKYGIFCHLFDITNTSEPRRVMWLSPVGNPSFECRYCLALYVFSFMLNRRYINDAVYLQEVPELEEHIAGYMDSKMLLNAFMSHISFNYERVVRTAGSPTLATAMSLEPGMALTIFNRAFAVWRLTVGIYLHSNGVSVYFTPHVNSRGNPTESKRLLIHVPESALNGLDVSAFFRSNILEMFFVNPAVVYRSCVKTIKICKYNADIKHGIDPSSLVCTVDIPGLSTITHVRNEQKLKVSVVDRSHNNRVTVHIRVRGNVSTSLKPQRTINVKNTVASYLMNGIGNGTHYRADGVDQVYAMKFDYDNGCYPDTDKLIENINSMISVTRDNTFTGMGDILKALYDSRLMHSKNDYVEIFCAIRVARTEKSRRNESFMYCPPTLMITRRAMMNHGNFTTSGVAQTF